MNPGMRQYEPLSGIEGVGSGQTATLKAPVSRRHLLTKLFCSATIVAGPTATIDPLDILDSITTIVTKNKGGAKVVRVEDVSDIVAGRAFRKLATDASKALMLDYCDPARADVIDEVVTGWDTFDDVTDVTYKIKIKSGLSGVAINAVNVFDNSVLTDSKGNKVRQIVKRTIQNYNLSSNGDIIGLPTDLPILGAYLIGEAGKTINHVKVTVDDTVVVHDLDAAQNLSFLSDYNLDGTAFGANAYALRFDVEGQISRRLEDIRSLKLKVTSSAANAVKLVLEQVAPDYM